jgi:hypothetical protein
MTPHALPYARFGRRNYEVRELSNVDPDANGAEAGKGYLRRGTPELRRANLAFFVAGLAMFAMLYCTRPLLPVFSAEFGVTPAVASLSLSLATGTLGDGPQASSFLVPPASHERIDAVGHTDQPQEDEQDPPCQHHGRKSRPTGIGPQGPISEIEEAECPASETSRPSSLTGAGARLSILRR